MPDLQPLPDEGRPMIPASVVDPVLFLAVASYLRAAGACPTCASQRTDALLWEVRWPFPQPGDAVADTAHAAPLSEVLRRGEHLARGCVTNRHHGSRA